MQQMYIYETEGAETCHIFLVITENAGKSFKEENVNMKVNYNEI